MSFSSEIKEELMEETGSARHCQLAELSALVSACGSFSIRPNRRLFLLVQSENRLVVRKAFALIRRAFDTVPEVSVMGSGRRGRLYTLAVTDAEQANRILKGLKLLTERGALRDPELAVNGLMLQSTCCKRAFLRGAFIGSGSVSDPHKSYHLEIVCINPEKAEQLRDAAATFGIDARIVLRKRSYVVYVKESEGIADFLNVIGAHRGLMEMENIRILREISGHVNRSVNCETANLGKTVSAAVEQIRAIEKIRNTVGLDTLPAPLLEMAAVRLENPDTSLKDLGNLLDPPVGKSGVNHRLRKLKQIADEL